MHIWAWEITEGNRVREIRRVTAMEEIQKKSKILPASWAVYIKGEAERVVRCQSLKLVRQKLVRAGVDIVYG